MFVNEKCLHERETKLHRGQETQPLKFTNASVKRTHFTFLLHEFRSRFSKQMISVSIKKRSCNVCRVRESSERFITSKNLLMSEGKFVSVGKCFLIQTILA